MRYAYTGEPCPIVLPVCLWEGWLDARIYRFWHFEQLYRDPWWKRAGYFLGFIAGRICGVKR